jgi:1,4-alpha-glucan branching enzyme
MLIPGVARATWPRGEKRGRRSRLIKVAKPASDGTVRVTFALPAAEPAGAVSVVGSFNGWDPYAHPLRKRANGLRSAVVTIPAGSTVHFRYLAEGGVWFDDDVPAARDAQGSLITLPG